MTFRPSLSRCVAIPNIAVRARGARNETESELDEEEDDIHQCICHQWSSPRVSTVSVLQTWFHPLRDPSDEDEE